MVKHVLFVKLKNPGEEECRRIKELFLSMKERIDFIREIQVGVDFLHSQRSYDVALELTVDSRADLERYQSHPYHVEQVKPVVHQMRQGSATVDYEF